MNKISATSTFVTKRRVKQEKVTIKQLFNQLQIPDKEYTSYIPQFDLKVKTKGGYSNLMELFRTETQPSVLCSFSNGKTLECSTEHLLMRDGEWTKVAALRLGDQVETEDGVTTIESIKSLNIAPLYDVAVEGVHAWYTNGIYSHNSWGLINVGAHAIKLGFNVVHYTLELGSEYVARRYDSLLSSVESKNLNANKDHVSQIVSDIQGDLTIIEYLNNIATCDTIRASINSLIEDGKRPDVIIVDYADLLASSSTHSENRFNVDHVLRELIAVGNEFGVPVYTASQGNRQSAEKDILTAEDVAESYGKAMIAHFMISMARKTKDKETKTARFHVIKNRFGEDGMIYPGDVDLSIGKMVMYEQNSVDGQRITELSKAPTAQIPRSTVMNVLQTLKYSNNNSFENT